MRKRFIETLDIAEEDVIFPENPQLFLAMGAALAEEETRTRTIRTLIDNLENDNSDSLIPQDTLERLFENEQEVRGCRHAMLRQKQAIKAL